MKVLIDGDIIAYRVGFASEHTHYDVFDNGAELQASFDNAKECNAWLKENDLDHCLTRLARVEPDPLKNCLHSVKIVMQKIIDKYGDDLHVYFSCHTEDNWRYSIYPEYKANRKPRKPYWRREIREYMERKWPCQQPEYLEADDIISMDAAQCLKENVEHVVVTIDKDMLQIPGWHYNWVKDEEQWVSEMGAIRNLSVQRIMGDSTDNIKGIPGWGQVAAEEWLAGWATGTMDDWILSAYEKHYRTDRASAHQLSLAHYHAKLNTALVTLPTTYEQLAELATGVQGAKNCIVEAASDSASNTCGVRIAPIV